LPLFVRLRVSVRELSPVEQFPNGSANLLIDFALVDQTVVLRTPPFGLSRQGLMNAARIQSPLATLVVLTPQPTRATHFVPTTTSWEAPSSSWNTGQASDLGSLHASMAGLPRVAERSEAASSRRSQNCTCSTGCVRNSTTSAEPEGFVVAVGGLADALELVAPVEGASQFRCCTALGRSVPNLTVSVLHNDYKLSNCPVHSRRTGSSALGLRFGTWRLRRPVDRCRHTLELGPTRSDTARGPTAHSGGMGHSRLPSRAEILIAYPAATGLDVSGIAGTKRSLASRPRRAQQLADDMRSANRQTQDARTWPGVGTDGSSGRALLLRRRSPDRYRMSLPDTASPVEGQIELMTGLAPTASKETTTTARPLEGSRREAASYITGPFAAQALADLGAAVLKISRRPVIRTFDSDRRTQPVVSCFVPSITIKSDATLALKKNST